MKRISYPVALISLCLACAAIAQPSDNQDSAPPPPPPAPAKPIAPPPPDSDLDAQSARVRAEMDRAKQEMKRAEQESKHAMEEQARATSFAFSGMPGDFNFTGLPGMGHAGRSLVIRSSESDPKTLAADEEDLNIMGRILEKALTGDEDQMQAMGIKLNLNLFGSGSAKNLRIEGYGAIFMLNVNFPLVGQPANPDENTPPEPTNSTWDEARRELYGQPRQHGHEPKAVYDPKRVEKLKNSLLDALKNASNMHSLKSDESVTLVVTSNGNGQGGETFALKSVDGNVVAAPARSGGGGGSSGGTSVSVSGGSGGGSGHAVYAQRLDKIVKRGPQSEGAGTVLTIRARKSDIDAFAKGKLNFDEFRNKATVLLY